MFATVAVAAVLGFVITTTTTIGTGIFLQQAKASDCNIILDKTRCSDTTAFRSQAFNYQGMTDPGQPYLYKELPQSLPTTQPPIVLGPTP